MQWGCLPAAACASPHVPLHVHRVLQVRSRPINSAASPAIINTYLHSSNASAPVLHGMYANVTGLSSGVGYQV